MLNLDELRVLVALIDSGSIAGAAVRLQMPRSTVRRRLGELTGRFGVPLYAAEGGRVELTTVGSILVRRGRQLLADAAVAERQIRELVHGADAIMRIAVDASIHPALALRAVEAVRALIPDARLVLTWSADPVAHLRDGFDLAIYWGGILPDGPWRAQRFGTTPLRLIASTPYVEAQGRVGSLEGLHEHPLYLWSHPDLADDRLPLRDGTSHTVAPVCVCSSVVVGWEAARQGRGIALAPAVGFPDDGWPAEQREVLLPDLVGYDVAMWLVAPASLTSRPPIAAFVEAAFEIAESVLDSGRGLS